MTKANSASSPLAVRGHDIVGNKGNGRRLANSLVLIGLGIRCDQGKHGRTVGRRNPYPAFPGLEAHIKGQTESKLIHVESQASVLIANENVGSVNAEVGVLALLVIAIMGRSGLIRQTERRGTGHGGYYKTTKNSDQLQGSLPVPDQHPSPNLPLEWFVS